MAAQAWIDSIIDAYRTGRGIALLFSYDGTLAHMSKHPSQVHISSQTRELLQSLSEIPETIIGVLSGRGLKDLKTHIGLERIHYAGSSGMHLSLAGHEVMGPRMAEFDTLASTLIAAFAELIRWFPGTWIETKPGCMSLHYRELTPLKAACFCELVRDELVSRFDRQIRVREVSKTLEFTLVGCWTKGDAVKGMLESMPQSLPVYASDGANDIEALAEVNRRGGITIGVGEAATSEVQYHMESPSQLASELHRLLGHLGSIERGPLHRRIVPSLDASKFSG